MNVRGRRFGRLKAIAFVGIRNGHASWLCWCECGSPTIQRGSKLRSGEATSCGCLRRDPKMKRAIRLQLPAARRRAIAQLGAAARKAS